MQGDECTREHLPSDAGDEVIGLRGEARQL